MPDLLDAIDRVDTSAAAWAAAEVEPGHILLLRRITNLGATKTALAAGAAASLIDRSRTGSWRAAFRLALIIGGQNLIHNGIKVAALRRRPSGPHHAHFAGSSFPSGHTATAAATWPAIAATLSRSPAVRATGYLAGTAVGTTRVLLGVHWLSDVVAGLALGWGWQALLRTIFRTRP